MFLLFYAALRRNVHNLFIMQYGATFTTCLSIVYKKFIDKLAEICYYIVTVKNNTEIKLGVIKMTKIEFKKWAREMCKKAETGNIHNVCDIVVRNNVTVCVDSKGKVGIAKCHSDDIFDYDIGIAIAYARCKGIEVPKVATYKKLSEMKNGEMFKGITKSIYRYIGKNKDAYVAYRLDYKQYYTMPCDVEYEMVD